MKLTDRGSAKDPYLDSYDEYLQLCQSTGIAPMLDKSSFAIALEDRKKLRGAFGFGELGGEGVSIDSLDGLSNAEILRKLDVALHLDELCNAMRKD